MINHLENLKNQFDKIFEETKSVYSEVDTETHTSHLRSVRSKDDMEENKFMYHGDLFIAVIVALISHSGKFSFLNKLDELSSMIYGLLAGKLQRSTNVILM